MRDTHTPNRITLNEATMIKVLIATQLIYDPDWIILSSGIVRGGVRGGGAPPLKQHFYRLSANLKN